MVDYKKMNEKEIHLCYVTQINFGNNLASAEKWVKNEKIASIKGTAKYPDCVFEIGERNGEYWVEIFSETLKTDDLPVRLSKNDVRNVEKLVEKYGIKGDNIYSLVQQIGYTLLGIELYPDC